MDEGTSVHITESGLDHCAKTGRMADFPTCLPRLGLRRLVASTGARNVHKLFVQIAVHMLSYVSSSASIY